MSAGARIDVGTIYEIDFAGSSKRTDRINIIILLISRVFVGVIIIILSRRRAADIPAQPDGRCGGRRGDYRTTRSAGGDGARRCYNEE